MFDKGRKLCYVIMVVVKKQLINLRKENGAVVNIQVLVQL
jgi:hypothetical protein